LISGNIHYPELTSWDYRYLFKLLIHKDKIMKKIYLFILVIITIAFMEGCETALDLAPVSSVTDAKLLENAGTI